LMAAWVSRKKSAYADTGLGNIKYNLQVPLFNSRVIGLRYMRYIADTHRTEQNRTDHVSQTTHEQQDCFY
jgi:hypothetical protein